MFLWNDIYLGLKYLKKNSLYSQNVSPRILGEIFLWDKQLFCILPLLKSVIKDNYTTE